MNVVYSFLDNFQIMRWEFYLAQLLFSDNSKNVNKNPTAVHLNQLVTRY